jgi:hypothetical protein
MWMKKSCIPEILFCVQAGGNKGEKWYVAQSGLVLHVLVCFGFPQFSLLLSLVSVFDIAVTSRIFTAGLWWWKTVSARIQYGLYVRVVCTNSLKMYGSITICTNNLLNEYGVNVAFYRE